MKLKNLKVLPKTLLLCIVISQPLIASERYETQTITNTTVLNISEADIAEAIALGASTVDVRPDRGMSYLGMGVTNYGGEEAISATIAKSFQGGSTIGASAAKANGGSDILFKAYGGFQW